ncbi:MAG: hypothetical protein K2J80_05900 [Oscillospiraceae bacterium]|nr:hypothetical protein [Oscillospiraceae bacterium]
MLGKINASMCFGETENYAFDVTAAEVDLIAAFGITLHNSNSRSGI